MSLCCFCKGTNRQLQGTEHTVLVYYNIKTVSVLSKKLSFCCPRKNETLLKQCCDCFNPTKNVHKEVNANLVLFLQFVNLHLPLVFIQPFCLEIVRFWIQKLSIIFPPHEIYFQLNCILLRIWFFLKITQDFPLGHCSKEIVRDVYIKQRRSLWVHK